jgi:hypothetical protein
MALSAFDDKNKTPKAKGLQEALGRSGTHWDNLIAFLKEEYAPLEQTWSYGGSQWGWTLRLKRKKRTILYMTPAKKFFHVGFALGEKAVGAAHESSLPGSVLTIIDEAKRYAEGRAVRLEVRARKDLDGVKKLAAIKMAN